MNRARNALVVILLLLAVVQQGQIYLAHRHAREAARALNTMAHAILLLEGTNGAAMRD